MDNCSICFIYPDTLVMKKNKLTNEKKDQDEYLLKQQFCKLDATYYHCACCAKNLESHA